MVREVKSLAQVRLQLLLRQLVILTALGPHPQNTSQKFSESMKEKTLGWDSPFHQPLASLGRADVYHHIFMP